MIMKKALLLLFIAVALISCKNSKTKKDIVGTWFETKIDGVDVPAGAQDQLIFTKVKGGEGDLTIVDGGSTVTQDFKYNIVDGGATLEIINSAGPLSLTTKVEIVTFSENEMTINWGASSYLGTYTK